MRCNICLKVGFERGLLRVCEHVTSCNDGNYVDDGLKLHSRTLIRLILQPEVSPFAGVRHRGEPEMVAWDP